MKYLCAVFIALYSISLGRAAPPIEAYGELPEIRSIALSPNGRYAAYLAYQDGQEALIVYELGVGFVGGVRTDNVKARSILFAGDRYVILRASDTLFISGYTRNRLEYSGAYSYDIETGNIVRLLQRTEGVYPAQEGLGRILGVNRSGDRVFMPAYAGDPGQRPGFHLFSVDLATGTGRVIATGAYDTIDWFVNEDGVVLAREDYDNEKDKYEILTRWRGGWEQVLEIESNRIPFALVGFAPSRSSLIVVNNRMGGNFTELYELSLEGRLSAPVFSRENASVEDVVLNIQREVSGVQYSGFYPQYEFYDESLNATMAAVQDFFGENAVRLASASDDFEKLLLLVAGSDSSGIYYIFDRSDNSVQPIANSRPQIPPSEVADVRPFSYHARDGLTIPAVLTAPPGVEPENLPLIVMPHGGPESYDSIGFDWMAQYFANRGYLVLQPNFRGSSGFGVRFRNAGRGEWGAKMQDDVTDGVLTLIADGRADPRGVCIIGASYGGYAALAGGAFTPELYKCVAAIAPVSDLPAMLIERRRDYGRDHWVFQYWTESIGDLRSQRDKLEAISPANHAAGFRAPVLLIHGKDDLVVPISQSIQMERALRRENKAVELLRLDGEDHWLSTSETRLATLKALDAFVAAHMGAE